MVKSFGDYNIEKSSSKNINNIKWTQKNPSETEKSKKKNTKKISPTNIIYTDDIEKVKPQLEKVFKVIDIEKSKKEKSGKRVQTSSVTNSKIQYSFSRRAR